MPWFPAALAVAFFAASEAAVVKKFAGDWPPLQMAALPLFYGLPIFFTVLMLTDHPAVPAEFWWTTAILLPLNAAGFLFHMAAVNLSPISLTMPYLAFTPAFVIVTGALVLGESLSPAGIAGIALIVAGSYVINARALSRRDLLAPFKAMASERGVRLMLFASLLYALCSVLGKKMVLLSDPIFSGSLFFTLFTSSILAGLLATGKAGLGPLLSRPRAGLLAGLVMAAHVLSHFFAVSLVQVAYMISVKRLSGLFSVLYGRLLFHETDFLPRLAGAGLMFAGTLFITLSG